MTDTYEVVDAKPYHVGQIVRLLRTEHMGCLARVGMTKREIHADLRTVFNDSAFRRAWLINGRLAGLGGVTGSLASSQGFIWLALSQNSLKFPLAIIKEARRQLRQIMSTKNELATTILADDEPALRFAAFCGFKVPQAQNAVAVRNGFVVPMGLHAIEGGV